MDKFKNKYRITTTRLQQHDYGKNGAYFITICTADRTHFFGEIANKKMQLNELGNCAHQLIQEIPNQFTYAELGPFVVMPDHIHVVIIINKIDDELGIDNMVISDDENENNVEHDAEARLIAHLHHVDGDNPTPTQKTGGFAGSKNPMLNENVSRIIRWYKGRCSFEMRKINPNFGWQSRFYDHIIRNAASFDRIQHYIDNNPANWGNEKR
jgi:REP element-mobilizing transposase RayT